MAATGYTPIILFNSTTPSAQPTTSNLAVGELALNIPDGKLYYNKSGVITVLANANTAAPVTTFSAGTTGFSPSTATSGAVTLSGTLATTNGGTGLTSFTANGVLYASSSSALTTGSALTFDGTNLGIGLFPTASKGLLQIGAIGYTDTGILAGIASSVAGYNQVIIQNTNSGSTASCNFNVSNNNGSSSTNFGEFGINSSGFTGSGSFNQAGMVYLTSASTDLSIGTYGSNAIHFVVNSGATDAMSISSGGLINVNSSTAGTALVTVTTSSTTPALKVPNIVETANTVAAAPSATTNFYLSSGAVQYYTSNAANNWTVNFAFSAGTSLNTAMAVGDSMSCTMLTSQGSTAYYNSTVTIDGTSVTVKWQGGSAPTSGNASSIDSYTYVIYKTASATYTVLATQTKFA
jgi:hypothetical protein